MHHWIKFNVIGLLGFVLQSAALFALTHISSSLSYVAATAVAVELAVVNNFVWHQRWTWADRPAQSMKQTMRRLVRFNVTTGLVSIAGNLLFMSIFVGGFHLPLLGASVITVAVCSILNFIIADRFAFGMNDRSIV